MLIEKFLQACPARHWREGKWKYAAFGRYLEEHGNDKEQMPNVELSYSSLIRHLAFEIRHSFVICPSSLVIILTWLAGPLMFIAFWNGSKISFPALGQMPQLDVDAAGEIEISTQFDPHRHVPIFTADAYKVEQVLIEVIHYRVP
jgi:hypothetical protein